MMSILYSWKEGLTLLLPRNLKLFAMPILKLTIECYKIYFRYFLIIPLIVLLLSIIKAWAGPQPVTYEVKNEIYYFVSLFILKFIYNFNLIVVWLAVRPWTSYKNLLYFKSMFSNYFFAFIVVCLINTLTSTELYPYKLADILGWFSNIWYLLAIFLITEIQNSLQNFFKSCWYALVIFFYNAPLLLIVNLLLGIFIRSIPLYQVGFRSVWFNSFEIILSPIRVCIFAIIYKNRLRNHYDLYFQQKEDASTQGNV